MRIKNINSGSSSTISTIFLLSTFKEKEKEKIENKINFGLIFSYFFDHYTIVDYEPIIY